jgi:hypothetical protein
MAISTNARSATKTMLEKTGKQKSSITENMIESVVTGKARNIAIKTGRFGQEHIWPAAQSHVQSEQKNYSGCRARGAGI